jgi:hypothetical protein
MDIALICFAKNKLKDLGIQLHSGKNYFSSERK